jgi:hypothetical protein
VQRICAWCGTDLGPKEPLDNTSVAATICHGCAEKLVAYRNPVLVVSRRWARLYEEIVELLRQRPEIQVVLDRRDPSADGGSETDWNGANRRRTQPPFTLD